MTDSNSVPVERQLAYLLFRVLLGIDICLHGVTRLAAGESGFAGKIESQFAHTALPHPLTLAFAFSLPWAEAVIGGLITIGLFTRMALALGLSIMILLMFGTCIVQDWQIAGLQLIYGLSYAALLFLLPCNRYSMDSILGARRKTH
jgi:thiosulfate dehydrogenase [quinone] large subunit